MAGKKLISSADEEKIVAAVAAAEKGSSIELVPYVCARCDSYPAIFWRMAVFCSFSIGILLVFLQPQLDSLWIILLQGLGLPLAYALSFLNFFSRLFLDDYDTSTEVHEKALQTFHELGVHRTNARTGILIFVALFEHRVEIVCDTAVSDKIPSSDWKKITEELARGIREGRLGDALANAAKSAGELAGPQFPAVANDKNELSNEIVRR